MNRRESIPSFWTEGAPREPIPKKKEEKEEEEEEEEEEGGGGGG